MLDLWLVKRQFTMGAPGREEAPSFHAPAQGDVYDFTVTVHSTKDTKHGHSPWREEVESEKLSELIRATVRRICRDHSIFEPAEAEKQINDALKEQLHDMERTRSTRAARWAVRVELSVPEEIRSLTRKALRERHEIETRADANDLRREKMKDLRHRWDEFLTEALSSPTAPHSLQLAERPQDIAQALKALQEGKRKDAEEFLTRIGKILEVLDSADILDLVLNSETVLRNTLKMMGIDLPIDPDKLLVPIEPYS
jgi:hypothetical protein